MQKNKPHIPLNELEDFAFQYIAIKEDAAKLVRDLSEAQFNWKPSPEQWSIAECFQHLIVTGRRYLPLLEAAIAAGKRDKKFSDGPFRQSLKERAFIAAMEPPYTLKVKAPKKLQPPKEAGSSYAKDETLNQLLDVQREFLRCIRDSSGLDLANIKMATALVDKVRFTLREWYVMLVVHERRHIWQARQIMKNKNFPGR